MTKFFSKKIGAILGTAVIATGLLALPALASTQNSGGNWLGQMRMFMRNTFTPGQHQQIMNSSAMQNLHNSNAMQQAMQSGDVNKMQELMNTDPQLKAQLGQDTLNKMNEFMSQNKAAIGQAMKGQNYGTTNQYMNSYYGQMNHNTFSNGMGSGMMGTR